MYVASPGSAALRVIDDHVRVVCRVFGLSWSACATPGCQTETAGKGLGVKCRARRGGDIDWLHLLISKSEAAYLKKAWYGRGLHYHSSLTFSTRYT
jgi:hypothetical protein